MPRGGAGAGPARREPLELVAGSAGAEQRGPAEVLARLPLAVAAGMRARAAAGRPEGPGAGVRVPGGGAAAGPARREPLELVAEWRRAEPAGLVRAGAGAPRGPPVVGPARAEPQEPAAGQDPPPQRGSAGRGGQRERGVPGRWVRQQDPAPRARAGARPARVEPLGLVAGWEQPAEWGRGGPRVPREPPAAGLGSLEWLGPAAQDPPPREASAGVGGQRGPGTREHPAADRESAGGSLPTTAPRAPVRAGPRWATPLGRQAPRTSSAAASGPVPGSPLLPAFRSRTARPTRARRAAGGGRQMRRP